ncbi:MAG: hypothetical protein GF317_24490 [Candidatus Lokiarchaeota archaeon]|nr:hypothetical protein [Candidatus Lokiarchaeota archaeon]MBD3202533.1 hypothetical protein [Candidatus Lokiarchaeota archaeon]
MRAARVFRWAVRIFVLFLTLTMSIVSFLGGLSAVNILTNPSNVQIDTSSVVFEYEPTAPEDTNLSVPFYINNVGYFDLNGLTIGIDITMIYNTTVERRIFNKTNQFPDIPAGRDLSDSFDAFNGDGFNLPEAQNIAPSPTPIFAANISLFARYSLDLLSFNVRIENQTFTP